MAVYWNVGLLTHTCEDADACVAFFQRQHLVIDDIEVPLEARVHQTPCGWLVGVFLQGVSHGTDASEPNLTTERALAHIARELDEWLRHAPPFAVALFGREAFDFFLALDDITDILGIEGMFIDDATWVALGRPATALSVGLGRRAWVRR